MLYAEQGIGDTIQFLRFTKQVKNKNTQVIIECQKNIRNLVALSPNVDHAITPDDEPPQTDFHAPLMSLPYLLGLTDSLSLQSPPYIKIENSEKKKPTKPRMDLFGQAIQITSVMRIDPSPLLNFPQYWSVLSLTLLVYKLSLRGSKYRIRLT